MRMRRVFLTSKSVLDLLMLRQPVSCARDQATGRYDGRRHRYSKTRRHATDRSNHSAPARRYLPAILALVGAVVLMVVVLFIAGHSGGSLLDPVGARAYEVAMTGIALAILGVGIVPSNPPRKTQSRLADGGRRRYGILAGNLRGLGDVPPV